VTESTDTRPLLFRTLDPTGRVASGVAADQLPAPTPCSEYDVRALLGHIVAVLRRVTHVASGGDPFDIPQVITDVADDEWPELYQQARQQLDAAWTDADVLDRMLTLPFGTMPGRAAAAAYTVEVTTHGWDLAEATGQTEALDLEVGAAALGMAQQFIPAQPRGGPVPFAAPAGVPADAGVYEQLAAWMGRQPRR